VASRGGLERVANRGRSLQLNHVAASAKRVSGPRRGLRQSPPIIAIATASKVPMATHRRKRTWHCNLVGPRRVIAETLLDPRLYSAPPSVICHHRGLSRLHEPSFEALGVLGCRGDASRTAPTTRRSACAALQFRPAHIIRCLRRHATFPRGRGSSHQKRNEREKKKKEKNLTTRARPIIMMPLVLGWSPRRQSTRRCGSNDAEAAQLAIFPAALPWPRKRALSAPDAVRHPAPSRSPSWPCLTRFAPAAPHVWAILQEAHGLRILLSSCAVCETAQPARQ
jgi:hypothetical protein